MNARRQAAVKTALFRPKRHAMVALLLRRPNPGVPGRCPIDLAVEAVGRASGSEADGPRVPLRGSRRRAQGDPYDQRQSLSVCQPALIAGRQAQNEIVASGVEVMEPAAHNRARATGTMREEDRRADPRGGAAEVERHHDGATALVR